VPDRERVEQASQPFEELKTSRRTATPAALFFFDLPQACYARIA
jgi:hypothetical protein